MKPKTTLALTVVLFLVCFDSSPPATAQNRQQAPPPISLSGDLIAVSTEGAKPTYIYLKLHRTDYEVGVVGDTVIGTCTQEFMSEQGSARDATYLLSVARDWLITGLELDFYGRIEPLHFGAVDKQQVKVGSVGGGSSQSTAVNRTRRYRSEPINVYPGESVILRTGFRFPLEIRGNLLKVKLPPVLGIQTAGTTPQLRAASLTHVPAAVRLTVNDQEPLLLARSPSHQISSVFTGDRTVVGLARPDIPLRQPFIFIFSVGRKQARELAAAGFRLLPGDRLFNQRFATGNSKETIEVVGRVRRGSKGRREIEAVLIPPKEPAHRKGLRPMQIVFVVDSSGSMRTEKIQQARRAVVTCVERLRAVDSFNIVDFDTKARLMSPVPVSPTGIDLSSAKAWLNSLEASGGTMLIPGLAAALAQPDAPRHHQAIVVVTDAMLGDAHRAFELIKRELGKRRLFVVGTGWDAHKETMLALARYGRGAAAFASDSDSLEGAVIELFNSISQPVGWDVSLVSAGRPAQMLENSRIPDLYAGHPVRILAWFNGEAPSELQVKMTTADGERMFKLKVPQGVR